MSGKGKVLLNKSKVEHYLASLSALIGEKTLSTANIVMTDKIKVKCAA